MIYMLYVLCFQLCMFFFSLVISCRIDWSKFSFNYGFLSLFQFLCYITKPDGCSLRAYAVVSEGVLSLLVVCTVYQLSPTLIFEGWCLYFSEFQVQVFTIYAVTYNNELQYTIAALIGCTQWPMRAWHNYIGFNMLHWPIIFILAHYILEYLKYSMIYLHHTFENIKNILWYLHHIFEDMSIMTYTNYLKIILKCKIYQKYLMISSQHFWRYVTHDI